MTSIRENILEEAARLTGGDRNVSYGPPHENLSFMADMVSAFIYGKYAIAMPLTSEDMAWLMVMAKISRTPTTNKADNYVDAAAYAAIAGECREIIEAPLDTI